MLLYEIVKKKLAKKLVKLSLMSCMEMAFAARNVKWFVIIAVVTEIFVTQIIIVAEI